MKEFIAAFVEAQKKMTHAIKTAENPFYKTKYADLSDVDRACRKHLNDHGIAILQPIDHLDGTDFVHTQLMHTSGEKIESKTRIINAKGDSQGFGSAVTYSRRYALAAICGVVTEDDDGENAKSDGAQKAKESVKAKATTAPSQESVIKALLDQLDKKWEDPVIQDYFKKITTKETTNAWTLDDKNKVIAALKQKIEKTKNQGDKK